MRDIELYLSQGNFEQSQDPSTVNVSHISVVLGNYNPILYIFVFHRCVRHQV